MSSPAKNNTSFPQTRIFVIYCLSTLVSLFLTPVLLVVAFLMCTARLLISLYLRVRTNNTVKLVQCMDSFQIFDRPNNLLETYTLLILKGAGDLGKIKKALSDKVINNVTYEKLRCRVVKKFGFYCWEILSPEEFRLEEHVKLVENNNLRIFPGLNNNTLEIKEAAFTEKQVFEKLSEFYSCGMQIDKPRWEVNLVTKFSYETDNLNDEIPQYAVIFRVHHSIMDGISMYLLISQALADVGVDVAKSMPFNPLKPLPIPLYLKFWTFLKLLFVWPKLMYESVGLPSESNCFHGPALSNKKIITWTNHFTIESLRKIRSCGGDGSKSKCFGTNAVLNAAVGGAFLRLAEIKGVRPVPREITGLTSIPMLPYPNLKPQNRFSGAFFPLRVGGVESRLDRVRETDRTLKEITTSPLILLNSLLLRFIGTLPADWSQNLTDSREFTVLTSNIPGPSIPGYLFEGDILMDVAGFLPIKNKTGGIAHIIKW